MAAGALAPGTEVSQVIMRKRSAVQSLIRSVVFACWSCLKYVPNKGVHPTLIERHVGGAASLGKLHIRAQDRLTRAQKEGYAAAPNWALNLEDPTCLHF